MYYLVSGIFRLMSFLPLWFLHFLSDCLAFFIYHVFRYRKKVVMDNLAIAFPEKTLKERKKIARKYYRAFSDNITETIKLISASPRFIEKHFTGNFSICDELYREGKKCHLLTPHNFNWEMFFLRAPLSLKHKFLVVYMQMSNKLFERMMMKARTKTGAVMLPANDFKNAIRPYLDEPYMLVLGADQNPGNPSTAFWFEFFGKPTPFARGPEEQSRKNNIPVIYCRFVRRKRGYYYAEFEIGEANPQSLPEGELTKRYISYLEKSIRAQPENWLWSHRRWRYSVNSEQ